MTPPAPFWKKLAAPSLLWSLVFFGLLWRLDFPKPMVDDLFYTGAGLNLANGGDLSNPLLARQLFPSHYFFVYPPLHSYALAGWLKIFGISAWSMTAFPVLMYCVIAASTIALLRKYEAPGWLEWLTPLAVSTALLPVGLRPEPLSIALTMAGFAIFACGRRTAPGIFCAFGLMALGASAAPRMAFFSAGLMGLTAFEWRNDTHIGSCKIRNFWLPATFALIAAGVIFLAQIHFNLGEFWQSFHLHSQRVGGRRINLILNFLMASPYLNGAQRPLLLLLISLVVFAWQPPVTEMMRASWALLGAFLLIALAGGWGAGTLWYICLALLLFIGALAQTQPLLMRKLQVVLSIALLLANAKTALIMYGMATNKIKSDTGEQAKTAAELRVTSEHPLILDHAVARYLYHYRLPAGVLDIEFSAAFPKSHVIAQLTGGDIFLIGPDNVAVLREFTLLDLATRKWVPFGLQSCPLDMHPRHVFIVPEESCHGLRAEALAQ